MATPPSSLPSKAKSKWPIIAIIVVGGLAAGLVYGVWRTGSQSVPSGSSKVKAATSPHVTSKVSQSPSAAAEDDAKTSQLAQYGDSTEVAAIDQDLQNTDYTGLDAEMGMMEKEI